MNNVDWNSYAQVYDLMAANNPAYQEILRRFEDDLNGWVLPPLSMLCDLGSGTGNFSLALASRFPDCRVLHVDSDSGMNELAKAKARKRDIDNIEIITKDVEDLSFDDGSLSAITTVHALYPLRRPEALIERFYHWLKPDGHLFVCDLGRVLDVHDWARYLFAASMRERGLVQTLNLFLRGRAVAKHNQHIRESQRADTYWTHSTSDFRKAFERAGFGIVSCEQAYRGYSDLIVCRKGTKRAHQEEALT